MAPSLDVQAVRKHFPALDKDQVYFDNAGGSQVLREVVDSVSTYLATTNVQLGASYPIGKQSSGKYEDGYEMAASYINAGRDEIVLGSSTTQLYRNLSMSLFEHLSPGSEIVISTMDHEANIASWVHMASLRSVEVKWWTPSFAKGSTSNPQLDPEVLRGLMSDKTKLVACTHTGNILGTISPIRAIADVVHSSPHALLCVDAVAYAPHREVDVRALDADFYAFSWYKLYGPHIAMLYASPRARAVMTSLGHFFKSSSTVEEMLGLAGTSYELLAGVPPVVRYLENLSSSINRPSLVTAWTTIAAHEQTIQSILLSYLANPAPSHGRQVTIWGEPRADASLRVPVISFTIAGWKSKDLVLAVQDRSGGKFGFRWGAFYSNRLVSDVLGFSDIDDGVARVSLVHYNTEAEVREFVAVLDEVLKEKTQS
ncbi:hypothetical protein ANO11243_028460 [Dothideomycetidae sp. 11243]|nr:hypothetical protein ANO11243_028460 [fungal sp. No.11243]